MRVDKFDTNFGNLSRSDFIVTLGNFADSLLDHHFFKDNWPEYLTHPLQLKDQLAAYHQAALVAEADGGRTNLKKRDDMRKEAHVSVVLMGQYVVMRSISENDPSFLKSVRLKLKSRPSKSGKKARSLVAPTTVKVKHGPDSGTVIISYNKVLAAGSYEIQKCEGDPGVEESWGTVGTYAMCRVVVKGLEPARKVYFRIICHGTGLPGPCSRHVGIIVL